MEISKCLKKARKNVNLSQQQVAEKLHVSRQTVSKWENSRGNPDLNTLLRLSHLYQISIDELLGETNLDVKDFEDNKKDLKNNILLSSQKDESAILVVLSAISCFIFPLGIAFSIFVLCRNNKNNILYKWIYFLSICALILNIFAAYTHLGNILDWNTQTQIEKIE